MFDRNINIEKDCGQNYMIKETKQELLKRFYKPFYIPVIALLCSFLLISGNYKPNYSKVKKYIFLAILLILIISEASLRYSVSSKLSFYFYLAVPIVMLISIYSFFIKSVKNV